jgi:adenylate cyclase
VHLYVTGERERKKVKETFRHYVAPLVVEEMLRDPQRLKLGGEERILTIFFSDLEGFTTHSERYAPHEVLGIPERLLRPHGAPIHQDDHAHRAYARRPGHAGAAQGPRPGMAQAGRPVLKARTGINSGLMLAGNEGSRTDSRMASWETT